jgi:DNA helicase-2/ATP-dependent DNA helicase PcrA
VSSDYDLLARDAAPASEDPVQAARDARVEALLEGLNPQQLAAVTHRGGPLLIVAGAGSGKTRVLAHRIGWLLAEHDVHPGSILAITFTNKAAAEMKERVARLVGGRVKPMWVSTFHSACVRILRTEATRLGYKSGFSIYDADDSRRLMTIVARELDLDPKRFAPRSLAHQVSNLKNELIDWETARERASHHVDKAVAEAYASYQDRLQRANAMDFDDLIMNTVTLLQLYPDVAEHYRRRFRHVLVDEYQDTNHAQYVLVRELVGVDEAAGGTDAAAGEVARSELCVVGDADQSIYAFRGATIRNILDFEADYPDATVVLLEQNYRSTQTILSAANAVIAKNPDRRPKRLWTDAGAGERIEGYVADNEHDEAAWVAQQIDRLADEAGVQPSDVAIFVRTNAQTRPFEDVFIRVGMPYKVVGGVRFYERREVRDAIAYLKVLVNPLDTVSLRRIVNVPKRGIGERAEAGIEHLAGRERIDWLSAMRRVEEIPVLPARSANAIQGFVTLYDELAALAASATPPGDVLSAVMDRSGLLAELANSEDPQEQGRAENLQELVSVAREFEQSNPDGGLADFLEQVALVADADEIPDAEGGGGVVTLMTLHTAKGLEFPVVFVTGAEDGVFPHLRSLGDPKELAEERRLAYVGLTRARERLFISRALTRSSWGTPSWNPPSRFLDDIPPDLIHWSGAIGPDAGTRSQTPSDAAIRRAQARGRPGGTGLRPIPSLQVGDRVNHDAFGMGRVVSVKGADQQAEAEVDFGGDAGVKRLLLRYAPLEKL